MRHMDKMESPEVFENWKKWFENKYGRKANFDEETRKFWINYFETIEDGKLKPFCIAVLHCLTNYI